MDIKTDNITALLREQIAKFDLSVDVSEVGGNGLGSSGPIV